MRIRNPRDPMTQCRKYILCLSVSEPSGSYSDWRRKALHITYLLRFVSALRLISGRFIVPFKTWSIVMRACEPPSRRLQEPRFKSYINARMFTLYIATHLDGPMISSIVACCQRHVPHLILSADHYSVSISSSDRPRKVFSF